MHLLTLKSFPTFSTDHIALIVTTTASCCRYQTILFCHAEQESVQVQYSCTFENILQMHILMSSVRLYFTSLFKPEKLPKHIPNYYSL